MIKTIYVIKENQKNITSHLDEIANKNMVFRKVRKDTIGKSASNPTWGYVYNVKKGKMKWKGEGLYKEFDYDAPNAAYCEKIASIMGRNLLSNTRVPEVEIVEENKSENGIISYKLMDNDKEDMFHLRDIMFYLFERDELASKKDIFDFNDILEAIKIQVTDEENYKAIEKSIIRALLFDSVINNGDRHTNNWALVRNKETNWYELAVFDHSSSFTDMLKEQRHFTVDGWVSSYTSIKPNKGQIRKGSLGKDIIEYIANNYNEYFNEFCDDFEEVLPNIIEEIKKEELPIDIKRLENKLYERKRFLRKIRSKEELEHEQ